MLIKTRCFGDIDLDEDKVLTFDNGIMGFEEYKKFTILYDNEDEGVPVISWLQSLDEAGLAIPVISPLLAKEDYNPVVEDELLVSLGDLTEENIVILLSMTIPSDMTKMTANLKAPFIINSDTRKGCQIIVENSDYEVKYNIYEAFQKMKKGKTDMLAMSRKLNESIIVGSDIEITILEVKGEQVKIGISAPKSVPVYRKELYVQIQESNKEAASADMNPELLKKLLK